jgi:uncharacterized membrane protein YobD (UPF0266 family)
MAKISTDDGKSINCRESLMEIKKKMDVYIGGYRCPHIVLVEKGFLFDRVVIIYTEHIVKITD